MRQCLLEKLRKATQLEPCPCGPRGTVGLEALDSGWGPACLEKSPWPLVKAEPALGGAGGADQALGAGPAIRNSQRSW